MLGRIARPTSRPWSTYQPAAGLPRPFHGKCLCCSSLPAWFQTFWSFFFSIVKWIQLFFSLCFHLVCMSRSLEDNLSLIWATVVFPTVTLFWYRTISAFWTRNYRPVSPRWWVGWARSLFQKSKWFAFLLKNQLTKKRTSLKATWTFRRKPLILRHKCTTGTGRFREFRMIVYSKTEMHIFLEIWIAFFRQWWRTGLGDPVTGNKGECNVEEHFSCVLDSLPMQKRYRCRPLCVCGVFCQPDWHFLSQIESCALYMYNLPMPRPKKYTTF